jgi:hypothetical protein
MKEGLSRRFVPNHFGGRFRKTVSRYFAKPNHRGYGGAGIVSFPASVSFLPAVSTPVREIGCELVGEFSADRSVKSHRTVGGDGR